MGPPTIAQKKNMQSTNGSYVIPKWFIAVNSAIMMLLAPAVPTAIGWGWGISTEQSVQTTRLRSIEDQTRENNSLIRETRDQQIRLQGITSDLQDLRVRVRDIETRAILPGAQLQIDALKERMKRIEDKINIRNE